MCSSNLGCFDKAPDSVAADDSSAVDSSAVEETASDDSAVDGDGDGWSLRDGDCDDADSDVHPTATETCDGVDQDCDGAVDEDLATTWYVDADGDGIGAEDGSVEACATPKGHVSVSGDCNDLDPDVSPGAPEYCNDSDDDCDGEVDEEAIDRVEEPVDGDGDGLGDPSRVQLVCDTTVTNTLDCDDRDATEPIVVDATLGTDAGDGTAASPLASIQAGIDAADVCVLVYPGTYLENIDFGGKEIEVASVDGPELTVIDGGGTGSVVSFQSGEGPAVDLHGFRITGGGGTESFVRQSWLCEEDVVCYTTTWEYVGGGIVVTDSNPTLWDLEVVDNVLPTYSSTQIDTYESEEIYSFGGGILISGSWALDLVAVDVHDNVAVDSSDVMWTNVTAAGNDPPDGSGIASTDASTVVVDSSIVSYGTGIGVSADSGGTVALTYSDVYGNTDGEFSGVTDPTGTDGNVSVDPGFTAFVENDVDDDDLTLASGSALIDAGNPAVTDADGSGCDVGGYGGPSGSW